MDVWLSIREGLLWADGRVTCRSGLPVALAATLLTLAMPARGELATIDVLLDLDEDAATGCVVGTAGGSAEGVDLRIRTLVDVGTEAVTSASTASCVDPLSGAFGGESEVPTAPLAPWSAVVGNGVAGSMLVETHVPRDLVGTALRARAFVVLSSVVGEDVLLAGDAGAPLLISLRAPSVPALGPWALGLGLLASFGLARASIPRRAVATGAILVFVGAAWLVPARGWALLGEGELRRWLLEERVSADPEGDAPAGVDLLEFYSAVDVPTGELWLRVDILFGAPVCLAGWGQIDPGVGFVCTMQPPPDQGPFGGAVALTFDDGPEPMVTPLILATLRAHGIPATFFVQGQRLESQEAWALALEIHEDPLFRLGNHSQTHTRFTLLDPEEVDIEVATASDRIREAIGDPCHAPRYFRFPFGSADCDSMGVVRSHGLAVASVHIDAGDWCYGANGGVCPESVIPWIPEEFRDDLPGYSVDQFLLKGGGVMLMHDVHANTAAELPAIIAGLQAAGASFVDLADPVLFPIMNGPIPAPEAPACCVAPMD